MEKYKEIVNDPAKLDASLKDTWAKLSKGKDSLTHDEFKVAAEEHAKTLNLPPGLQPPTDEEKEKARKLVDPDGTGKINFDGFVKLCKAGIAKAKSEGKL